MAEPTKKRWLDQHPRIAIGLGWASVFLGVAFLVYGGAAAAGEVDVLGKTCVLSIVTETEPAENPSDPPEVQSTESTDTCSPSGVLGPAAVPMVVGLILCIPAIRLLVADLELTFGPFSIKKAATSDAQAITIAEASNQDEWSTSVQAQLAELLVLVEDAQYRLSRLDEISGQVEGVQSRLDALPQTVQPRRKRRNRS